MEKEREQIKNALKLIGFNLKEGWGSTYYKRFSNHDGYEIIITLDDSSLNKSKIDYGNKIQVVRGTITNFSRDENLVVLECVNRLLEKGYKPENLILEKKWGLGHKEKGFLDIYVLNERTKKSFLMIECKRDESEYEKEKQKMVSKGGQLFSYYIQEPETEYLCLYFSELCGNRIEYKNSIIKVKENFKNKNQDEIHELWDKLFEEHGLLEKGIEPYILKFSSVKKSQLKELKVNDGRFIFNRFAEILRKNVVSDKTNAYNKIFNLFLCKIVDEDLKKDHEEMDFQWRKDEDNKAVMLRLNDLYKKGMNEYLQINIADYTQKEIDGVLSSISKDSVEKLREIIIELRLYTNNEFAFREVFDKKTFENNCIVVKEVVQLLQRYMLKYSTKHQFLGNFFEQLLNIGIKQEVGQFFTPVPLARFICKSIPIEEVIEQKNNLGNQHFLPYVIDFASGSGHFLTEVMDEINKYVVEIKDDWIKGGKRAIDLFGADKKNYLWAKRYVYGIEKDYRLAKTTKVSCFLNGDGDANILCADGLDNFSKSSEYNGLLKRNNGDRDNPVFDILISNPPYSVEGFKNTLKHGNESFELYRNLTDNSSEIECLFVERAKQLVKVGGYIGLFLPSSILINSGIYEKTREILLKYFEIKAIVELGSNTFMATGKNTIILFMKRRNSDRVIAINRLINDFFENYKDITCNQIEKAFSTYVEEFYDDLTFGDYVSLISGRPNEKVKTSEIYEEYKTYFNDLTEIKNLKTGEGQDKIEAMFFDKIREIEKEKLFYFVITYGQQIVLVKSGERRTEKEFLGYEFSKRRGYEGIKIYTDDEGKIVSKLYSEDTLTDESKVNSYILKNFRDCRIENIGKELEGYVKIDEIHKLIGLDKVPFDKKIITTQKPKIISKYEPEKLFDVCSIIDAGTNAPQDKKYFEEGKYPFIRAGNLNYTDENYVIPDKYSFVNDNAVTECNLKKFKAGTIVFPKSGRSITTDNIAILKEDSYVVNHLACIYDEDEVLINYIFYLLEDYKISNLMLLGLDYPSIGINEIKKFKVPVPPEPIQKKIVLEIREIEKSNKKGKEKLKKEVLKKYL